MTYVVEGVSTAGVGVGVGIGPAALTSGSFLAAARMAACLLAVAGVRSMSRLLATADFEFAGAALAAAARLMKKKRYQL